MRSGHWLLVLRLAVLAALAASMALLIDYTTPAEAFCGADSACAKVRGSGYGYLFNGKVPVPAVGLAGFASLFLLSLWQDSAQARKLLVYAAGFGSAVAMVLIVMQVAVVRQLCWLCMVADVSAVVAASAALMLHRAHHSAPGGIQFKPWAVAAAGLIAVGAPAIWPRVKPQPPVPPPIAALYKPGKLNVVEFFDFQCPHCRRLHPTLMKLKAQYGDQVHFVRQNFPLDFHLEARPSAQGYVCARAQGKGEELAQELMTSEKIGALPARKAAQKLGLDLDKYDACVKDPATDQVIDAESQVLRDAGMQGLPTTYVGGRRLIGNQPEDVFADAFRRAEAEVKSGKQDTGVPAWAYASICFALVGLVGWFGRRESNDHELPGNVRNSPAEEAENHAPNESSNVGAEAIISLLGLFAGGFIGLLVSQYAPIFGGIATIGQPWSPARQSLIGTHVFAFSALGAVMGYFILRLRRG